MQKHPISRWHSLFSSIQYPDSFVAAKGLLLARIPFAVRRFSTHRIVHDTNSDFSVIEKVQIRQTSKEKA
jgi:hypothetical protein